MIGRRRFGGVRKLPSGHWQARDRALEHFELILGIPQGCTERCTVMYGAHQHRHR